MVSWPENPAQTNLIECLDIITGELARGFAVDTIYLEFWKAFDTVPHERLLLKIIVYGFSGKILKWTRTFLSDRRQRVVVNGFLSSWVRVKNSAALTWVISSLTQRYFFLKNSKLHFFETSDSEGDLGELRVKLGGDIFVELSSTTLLFDL